MKPIREQKDYFEKVGALIDFIKRTNDIDSPTHGGDLYEQANRICEEAGLSDQSAKELEKAFVSILHIGRSIKKQ